VRFESWVNFQNESISKKNVRYEFHARNRTRDITALKWRRCHLSYRASTFQFEHLVYVWIYIIFSILDGCLAPVICWCVPTNRVLQESKQGRKPYSESELGFFRIHANQKRFKFSVSRSDFDSRCKPGVSSSWMEFDFCFAIENSRSFKTVICSTNSSSDYL